MTAPHPASRATPAPAPGPGDHLVLDLDGDVVDLAEALVDAPSVSGDERLLADAVEEALRALPGLEVLRDGDAVVARTSVGAAQRVLVAGHLDTVPVADNLPSRREVRDGRQWLVGRGSVDMKGGVAAILSVAAALSRRAAPGEGPGEAGAGPGREGAGGAGGAVLLPRDVTLVLYDHEEVSADLNGLGRLQRNHPAWLACDAAVLCEPTSGAVEGGCQGTLRARVRLTGRAAHTARAWTGSNAIHAAADVLARLAAHVPRTVEVDGLVYREGLQAVAVEGGIAGNVVPDACTVTVNHRFAPDRDVEQAAAHVREVLGVDHLGLEVVDSAPGARPGLGHPAVASLVAATGLPPVAKLGWTDVARFSAAGVPAVNYGPGDPLDCHTDGEACPTDEVRRCREVLLGWLTAP